MYDKCTLSVFHLSIINLKSKYIIIVQCVSTIYQNVRYCMIFYEYWYEFRRGTLYEQQKNVKIYRLKYK